LVVVLLALAYPNLLGKKGYVVVVVVVLLALGACASVCLPCDLVEDAKIVF